MRHVIWKLVFCLSLFIQTTDLSAQGRRVALVIGNSAYLNAPPLENPRNDAEDIADALETVGFEVIKGFDLDRGGMDRTLRDFARALPGASVGLSSMPVTACRFPATTT